MRRSSGKVTLARRSLLLAAATAALAPMTTALKAAYTERVMVDPISGLAIFGYDPVCYFLDGAPRAGVGQHELVWSAATWRFRSPGNLAGFQDDPDVYAPAFGGYAAEHVADGRAVESDPMLHAIVSDRLYLFRTAEGREEFMLDGHRAKAEAAWPALKASLLP